MPLHALRHLEPFTRLDPDALATLARHCRCVRLASGRAVATADRDGSTFTYLLKGMVRADGVGAGRRIRAGRPEASLPLPARATGVVITTVEPSEILYVDVSAVAFLLDRPSLSGFEVRTLDDPVTAADWRERFLRRGFAAGPPRLLQRAFASLRSVDLDRSDIVIEEGAVGDEYFIVASGCVEIRRRDGFRARLEPGDGFGEEALLGSGLRLASAVMLEGGRVMSLPGDVFRSALVPAAVRSLSSLARAPAHLVVDLDLPSWRVLDPRGWLASTTAKNLQSRRLTVIGGREMERLRFAFLAARAGFDVAVWSG